MSPTILRKFAASCFVAMLAGVPAVQADDHHDVYRRAPNHHPRNHQRAPQVPNYLGADDVLRFGPRKIFGISFRYPGACGTDYYHRGLDPGNCFPPPPQDHGLRPEFSLHFSN